LQARLERITREGGISISYAAETVKGIQAPALQSPTSRPEEWLRESLQGTSLSYSTVSDGIYAITRPSAMRSPAPGAGDWGAVSGTVLDERGSPVPGATVVIPGTNTGAVAGVDGHYVVANIPAGTITLQFSSISYETLRVSDVKVAPGKTTPLNVVLKESTNQLEEVVVTASYNRASATGLYAKQKNMVALSDGVSADLIKKTSDNNVAQVLKRVHHRQRQVRDDSRHERALQQRPTQRLLAPQHRA
jgi:hypothetical protein